MKKTCDCESFNFTGQCIHVYKPKYPQQVSAGKASAPQSEGWADKIESIVVQIPVNDPEIKQGFRKMIFSLLTQAEERGRKFGNEENARVKNSGKLLYQTGLKDGRTATLKEAIEVAQTWLEKNIGARGEVHFPNELFTALTSLMDEGKKN